jgi:hypothetical protein
MRISNLTSSLTRSSFVKMDTSDESDGLNSLILIDTLLSAMGDDITRGEEGEGEGEGAGEGAEMSVFGIILPIASTCCGA